MLNLGEEPVRRLTGRYWTDRSTRGEVATVARSKTRYSSYDDAVAGMSQG